MSLLHRNGEVHSDVQSLINTTVALVNQDSDEISGQSVRYSNYSDGYSRWSPEVHGATLAWRELSVYVPRRSRPGFKRIVNNVTGAVKPGRLVAVMGSSGAGKTTLMNALAHRNPAGVSVDGDILVNGRPLGPFMHRLSGFMHQEDLFVGSLTVREHLLFMARLKMDRRINYSGRLHRVNELLRQVGLYEARNTRIGFNGDDKLLSGGEKKRLAFATELLINPLLLFCDEPTTGLDSFSALKLVSIMSSLAANGRTIICTIHQPSSEIFTMFNQLILVADGRIAFNGETSRALEFFESNGYRCPKNYNPADYFIRTLAPMPGSEEASRAAVRRICDMFAVSDAAKELDVIVQLEFHIMKTSENSYKQNKSDFKGAFWWTKLFWLTHRCLLQVIRDPRVQALSIFQKILIGIMTGLCYLGTNSFTQSGIQSVQGALFILIAENTFSPMYATLAQFPPEFPLFLREYRSGLYSTSLYYLAKLISLFPGLVLDSVVFALITYSLAGLRATFYAFSMTMFLAAMVMNVSTACGCMFSCAFDSVALGMAYLIPFDYTLMITSGIFVKLSSLPSYISWVRFLSWLMYSNEAMTIIQWEGITNITCELSKPELPCLENGDQVLDNYSFSDKNLWKDIFSMVALYVTFHSIAYLFLCLRARRK